MPQRAIARRPASFRWRNQKKLAALRQFLILRHLQTAGARLRNQSAQTSRGNIFLKLKLFSLAFP